MKSDSHLPKKIFALLIALKNDEKCPLFHLKIFSFSRDLNVCFDFLIRKIRLLSKFNTSQPGWQTITIHKSSNISRSKKSDYEIWSVDRV